MTTDKRANFGTKLGVILASAGSAVGLGNIWRFPYMTGEYGGAAFIITYLGCVLLFGAPIMMAEFIIGRRSRSNTARAYQKLAPGTHWRWVGRMGVLAGFLILSYYSVVAGWTLEYMVDSAIGTFADKGPSDFVLFYESFVSNPWLPVVWTIVFLLLTHFIVVRGVEKGIERSSKVMMPALFILLLILAVCAMLLPGAERGLEFLLKPDLGKVDGSVLLAAMGQAFFSLSVGMGCLCTYASYFKPDTNLSKTAFSVAVIDTCVAILAGFIILLHHLPRRLCGGHPARLWPRPAVCHAAQRLPTGFWQRAFHCRYIGRDVLHPAGPCGTDFHHLPARGGDGLPARGVQHVPRQGGPIGDGRVHRAGHALLVVPGHR